MVNFHLPANTGAGLRKIPDKYSIAGAHFKYCNKIKAVTTRRSRISGLYQKRALFLRLHFKLFNQKQVMT